MEKVKLTQEQADAIETLREGRSFREDVIVEQHILYGWDLDVHKCLTNIANDTLIRALYIGYEVAKFKAGDWVTDTLNKLTFRIHAVVKNKAVPDWFEGTYGKGKTDESDWITIGYLRHATPEEIAKEKERRWWAKHDRGVWELKDRDLLIDISTGEICTVWAERNSLHLTTSGNVLLSIYDSKKLEDDYEVLCFAEDRKDA